MRYWIDCEYNGFGGQLLSLALVREDGHNLYIVYDVIQELDPWVKKNVMPILRCEMPKNVKLQLASLLDNRGAYMIQEFFGDDPCPVVTTDWPDDIKYLCQAMITGPGEMISVPRIIFDMVRVDAYPTKLPGAVQHNAYWDAAALKHLFEMV